ncbi:hypothetical protein L3Y34_006358 [Caenorhabditis briggsae]|uniref:Glucuronosyltransferase n=1 Tax=Caenorhabditis briggsae TaxID=6238 RepID=A0AAE8ZXC0_CAEBR|nr:hypothetical protein L3Y34_006358 [Caenorhabditis briggsae]
MHLNIIFLIFLLLISAHAKNILIYNSVFAYSYVKFLSLMANIIADHGHNVTLFRPYYINHNTEGLVKKQTLR